MTAEGVRPANRVMVRKTNLTGCDVRTGVTVPFLIVRTVLEQTVLATQSVCPVHAREYIRIFRENRSIGEEIVSLRWRCTRMSVERRGKGRKKLPRDGKKGRSVEGLNVVRAVTDRYEEKRSERRNNPVNDQSEAK